MEVDVEDFGKNIKRGLAKVEEVAFKNKMHERAEKAKAAYAALERQAHHTRTIIRVRFPDDTYL